MIPTMTVEEQVKARQERLNEKGTESLCPFCKVARAKRSDYLRCLKCGLNWLDEENTFPGYLDEDPRKSRHARFMAEAMAGSAKSKDGGA